MADGGYRVLSRLVEPRTPRAGVRHGPGSGCGKRVRADYGDNAGFHDLLTARGRPYVAQVNDNLTTAYPRGLPVYKSACDG